MSSKCYIVVEDYEDIKKVFLSKEKAEKFAQDLRSHRNLQTKEHMSLLENRVSINEADFDSEEEIDLLDQLAMKNLPPGVESCSGETIDGIEYRHYWYPRGEIGFKCWIDAEGKFQQETQY